MDIAGLLSELRSERDRLNQAIAALEGITSDGARRQRRPVLREVVAAGYLLPVEDVYRCS